MNFELKKPIRIKGSNFFGFRSELYLRPHSFADKKWRWRTARKDCIPITPLIAKFSTRRILLVHGSDSLQIFEHIGAVRFTGLIGVEAEVFGFPRCLPPYDGCALEIWKAVKPYRISHGTVLPRYTVSKSVQWTYPEKRGGQQAYTRIEPDKSGELVVAVFLSFPKYGTHEEVFRFPNDALMESVLAAKTPGLPGYLRPVSRAASLLGWPHHSHIYWPNKADTATLLGDFARHRVLDVLGALSLLCNDGLFSGRVISRCSGHRADIEAVKMAYRDLKRVS